jgi:hypothetical protein
VICLDIVRSFPSPNHTSIKYRLPIEEKIAYNTHIPPNERVFTKLQGRGNVFLLVGGLQMGIGAMEHMVSVLWGVHGSLLVLNCPYL